MDHSEANSAIVSPRGTWWRPAGRQEKTWVVLAFVWCLVLFAMMPLWHFKGGQNPSGIRAKVDPAAFAARVERFVNEYKIGEDHGIPVVAPPPGSAANIGLARSKAAAPPSDMAQRS